MEEKKGAGLLMIGVGTHLSAMTVVGFLLGYGADQLLDMTPVFMLLFGALGFVGGTIKAHKMLIRYY